MPGAGLYYGQDITGLNASKVKPEPKRPAINIDGYGKFYVDESFFTLDKEKQDEVVASIMEAQDQRIPIYDIEDAKTKQDIVVEGASLIPGTLAGAKAGAMLPVPPILKPVTTIAGGIAGGEAMDEYVEPVVRPVVEALTPPDSWDDGNMGTFKGQAKNLYHDLVTGNWDDY